MAKAWLKRTVLWLGLLLCLYALWRGHELAGNAIGRVGVVVWGSLGLLLVVNWLLAVVAWRQYLLAYTGLKPVWRTPMRQLGLLLVGKYVPGGVFGFLARMYDQPGESRRHLFWAGLVEQAAGVSMAVALGGALYLAAARQSLSWACLVMPLPLLTVAGVRLMHRIAVRLPWLRRYAGTSSVPGWTGLLSAVVVQFTQLLSWVVLIAMLAHELYGLDAYAALGVAGAFWLAVAAGMLAFFAPGGIGVREAVLIGLASPWLDLKQAIVLAAFLRVLNTVLDLCAGGVTVLLGLGARDPGRGE